MARKGINRFLNLLCQPYPLSTETSEKITLALVCGFFVALFLLVFQPFQLNQLTVAKRVFAVIAYGLITTFGMLFNDIGIKKMFSSAFSEEKWTVKKQLAWFIYQIIFISITNLLFSTLIGLVNLSIGSFLFFQSITLAVGIFPVFIITITNYVRLLKRNTQVAAAIALDQPEATAADVPEIIDLTADNGKDKIIFPANALLFITSSDNYSTLFLMKADNLQKELIRGSLTRLEQQINTKLIRRCHRSYIVNLFQVTRVSGNAQGYNLHFAQTETLVPVSRKYSAEILQLLKDK
ncbi:LytR/AlgR family response regulator transcription factor [Pontibacter sp. 13R65]|uniref:LytR/AlgR family response regulator transcription factor n=1 Tax=Pontibacter sp. 13R65 TaxID=3127458 RepID=UPI00301CCD1C